MKKIFTIMFAVLMVTAMGMTVCNDAWAQAKTEVNTTSNENGSTTTVTNSGSSSVTRDQTKDSTSKGSSTNWHLGYDKDAGGGFLGKLLSGSGISGGSSKSTSNAGTFVTTANGTGAVGSVAGTGGVGLGGYMGMAGGTAANLGSAIWGTVTGKLLDLFGNVKTVLYILAAFGLVGFAFMALFGKVRWGWVCALAFGLAAVAAAGQIIDYVSQAGVGGAMYDTLGTNTY